MDAASPEPPADEGLLPENYAELNSELYEQTPWMYLRQRLNLLVLVASDPDGYRGRLSSGLTLGSLKMTSAFVDEDPQTRPTPEQSFCAIEADVLLHQAAETVLRLTHAHCASDPCPWLRMSRLTSARKFKSWVEQEIVEADRSARVRIAARTFAHDDNEDDLRAYAAYLETLGHHFLASGSYNAAKHGMGIDGSDTQLTISLHDQTMFDREGKTITWLERVPSDGPPPRRLWTRASRQLDLNTAVATIHAATALIESIWDRARTEYLGEELNRILRPMHPGDLFAACGTKHPVLSESLRPLRYEGIKPTIVVRMHETRGTKDEPAANSD